MKFTKKLTAALLALIVPAFAVTSTSCRNQNQSGEKSYTVGIAQFGPHASLDNCRDGFIAGLKDAGFEEDKNLVLLKKDANFDNSTATAIAAGFANSEFDLICAIATPMAVAAMNAAYDTDIPVVYTAVNDPKASKLTSGNVTGTSDKLPVEQQLKLIRALMPEAESIGILYTTSEANSISTIAEYKRLAPKYNFKIISKGVTQASEVSLAADSVVSKADCLTNLTDNTVVGALATVLDKANSAGIPVFGSEIEQVKKGCVASEGIDYFELGRQTGAMAAKILNGESEASQMPFEEITQSYLYINKEVMNKFGLKLPAGLAKRAQFVSADDASSK